MPPRQPSPASATDPPGGISTNEITIGILAALPVEGAAMAKLIDDLRSFEVENDPNHYRIGSIPSNNPSQPHRVALAVLPQDGTRSAASMSTNLLRSFGQVRCVIMMGIAGGIPRLRSPAKHVRLGDVVVASSGIIDYGHIRQVEGAQQLRRSDGQISSWMRRAARELQFKESSSGDRPWERWLDPEGSPHAQEYPRPDEETDRLYVRGNQVPHPDRSLTGHPPAAPKIHYGSIASADVLMRDEDRRDELMGQFDDLLAVEMEGSGIAASTAEHDVPWFMVRGVTDYCEPVGKNDVWHRHASYATAAYVRALLEECRPYPRVLPLVQTNEHDRLVALLSRLPALDLRSVCEAACPYLPEIPPDVLTDPERAFHYLSGLNAAADGLPPALAYIDELATRSQEAVLAAQLHIWVDERAQLMRAEKPLERRRARRASQAQQTENAKPCLLIEISIEGIDHQNYRINSWIQERSGPWRPRPGPGSGEAKGLTLSQAEAHVVKLVYLAEHESDWQAAIEPVAIEFLLPAALLNLPVEWWRPPRTEDGHPLCVDYVVVVRSLDRMVNRNHPRMWVKRWRALLTEPLRMKVHWGVNPSTNDDLAAWDVRMRSDEEIAMVVLSGPPEQSPGREELGMALRAGVPVILWGRRETQPPSAADTIRVLTGEDPHTLPDRTKTLRAQAAATPPVDRKHHPGKVVVLLWDDPGRLVETGRSP